MSGKSEKKRMEELIDGMSQRGEIIKKDEVKKINEDALDSFYKKLQKNAFEKGGILNELGNSHSGQFHTGGKTQTVNSILDVQDSVHHSKFGMPSKKMPAVNSGLKPKEALEISIKRTIESGDPVNGIAFYDEVNWNLAKMGFNPKHPIDIKKAISDLMKYGEIKNQ